MAKAERENLTYRGLIQSADGVITKIVDSNSREITFQTTFGLNDPLVARLEKTIRAYCF